MSLYCDIITNMFGFYTLILILQGFCVYHAYRRNAEQRWYWIILIVPIIGCGLYLYHHYYGRNTMTSITESGKDAVSSNEVEQMERALEMTDNVTNKVNLADVYLNVNRVDEAISLYKQVLSGFMAGDPTVTMKLLQAFYLKKDYSSVIEIGNILEKNKSFDNSEQRISFAWALHHVGQTEAAGRVFELMDKSYTNYMHRVEYCKFLKETNQQEKLQEKIGEITVEFELMKGRERKMFKNELRSLEGLDLAKA